MQFIKKSVRSLFLFFFVVLIFNLAIVTALVMTFNSPKKIEKSLSDSGVYKTFITGALLEVQKSNDKDKSSKSKSNNDIPIDNPAVVEAANKAFNPELLQTTTENVLNGTYDWLGGKTQTPDFTIDFVAAKKTFAAEVGKAAQARLVSLPVCTPTQVKALGTNANVDAFTATCVPKGFNINAQQKKITSDLASSKDFLGTPKLTPQNLPKNEQGKTIFQQAAEAPKIYKWINASPLLLAGLAVLIGLITLALYKFRRWGIHKLATSTTVVGIILLFTNIATTRAIHLLNQPTGKLGEAVKGSFQQTIIKALNSISGSIEQMILLFGIAYLVLGIGTLIILRSTKPKNSVIKADKSDKTPSPDKPADKPKESPKPPTKPVSKPKPIQG